MRPALLKAEKKSDIQWLLKPNCWLVKSSYSYIESAEDLILFYTNEGHHNAIPIHQLQNVNKGNFMWNIKYFQVDVWLCNQWVELYIQFSELHLKRKTNLTYRHRFLWAAPLISFDATYKHHHTTAFLNGT